MAWRAALVMILLAGCTWRTPRAPEPVPDAGCAEACTTLAELGCYVAGDCAETCERLQGQADDTGEPIRALDTECIAGAETCQEVELCD